LLQEQGFASLGLGPNILRAPTAVVAGLSALAVGRLSGW
jgi:16S rRNA U1498 N3-methylase RsmE